MRLNLPNYLRLRRSPLISSFYFLSRRNISNKLSVEFAPGRMIRWRKRRFVVVDCTGFEAIIAPELGVIRKGVDGVNSFSHWPITTDTALSQTGRFSVLDL